MSDRISDRIKSGVIIRPKKEIRFKLDKLVQIIYIQPLLNAEELASKINVSVPTANRYLRTLKLIGVFELKGAYKTGGYIITHSFESVIEINNEM